MDERGSAEEPQRVLQFWCGPLQDDGFASKEYSNQWWTKDPELDERIRQEFGALHSLLNAGERPVWLETPSGLVAAVVVLDQFSRNMFRGTPAMYASDTRALALCFEGLALGFDRKLPAAHRTFLYMPLMHSERLVCQVRCVALFAAFKEECTGDTKKIAENNHWFAEQHHDIVARFGRFPHRNQILGRNSTPDEIQFLQEPNSSF